MLKPTLPQALARHTPVARAALTVLALTLPATAAWGDVEVLETVIIQEAAPLQPAGRQSVSGETLRHVPGSLGDPLKALQSLPGVTSTTDASSAPAIRGSRPEDNRYFVDGLPSGNLFHVGGLTSVLHPALVQRFDLYSAAYGAEFADATGGVIDVKLRRPRTDHFGGTLDVSLLGADLLLEGPVTRDQSFYFATRRSWIDLVAKQASDGKDANSDGSIVQMPRYADYLGKYLWRLDDQHTLSLHASGATDRLSLEVPAQSNLGRQQPVLAGKGGFRSNDHTEALTLESQLGGATVQRLSVGQHVTRDINRIGSALNVDVDQHDRFVIERFSFKPAAAHEVSLGAEWHDVRANYTVSARNALCTEFSPECDYGTAADLSANGRLDMKFVDLHASDRWAFTRDWAATAGVHYAADRYLHRANTEPRLGLQWQWSPDTLVSLAWGRYDQRPTPDLIVPVLGNPRLDHLHATHTVAGISHRFNAAWSVQAEVYRKAMSDLVVGDAARNYINAGSGTADGLEWLLKKSAQPGDAVSGWLSVSWARSQRRNDLTGENFRFAYDQPLLINLVASMPLWNGWEGSAKWTYHTGHPDTAVIGTGTYPDGRVRPIYGPLNGSRVPPYHRLDLRAEKQVSKSLHYYVELINAYDRKNVDSYGYSADYQRRYAIDQLGLLTSVGLKWTF